MATQALFQEQHAELSRAVRGWDRRLRAQQTLLWLARSLVPGLLLGLIVAVISRLRPWLLPQQIAVVSGVALVAGLVVMLVAVWAWRRPMITSARRFDLLFRLDERVSTALELMDGRIHGGDELVSRQVADAWDRAQTVRAGDGLPLGVRWREWALVLALAALLVALIVLPNPQTAAVVAGDTQKAAIEDAAEEVRDITQKVAADPNLNNTDRQSLLEALDTTLKTLEQPNITPEEAFASLSDAQANLEQRAEQLEQQAQQSSAASQAASDALKRALEQLQHEREQQEQQSQSLMDMLKNLQQSMAGMNQQQQQQAAQGMQQASQSLSQTNPQASQQLQQAAQAAQNGQTSAAQNALQQAQQSIQQGQQSQQQSQSAAQQMQQSAQQAQQAANQVAQAGQQAQQQSGQAQQGQQTGQQQQAQGSQSQLQQAGQQQGQQGSQQSQSGQSAQQQNGQQQQSGQQAGQQSQSSQGQQQGQQGQQGQGQQGGQQSQSGQGQTGQMGAAAGQQGQQQGQQGQSGQMSGGSAGAGDAAGNAGSDDSGATGQQQGPVAQNNNPDGVGQGQFAPIYAPRRLGGDLGSDQMVLEPDGSGAPVVEGEFAQNPNGSSSVPYDQVYSNYANSANRALDSDYIPLGMKDVVRNYFSSLDPSSSSGGQSATGVNQTTP